MDKVEPGYIAIMMLRINRALQENQYILPLAVIFEIWQEMRYMPQESKELLQREYLQCGWDILQQENGALNFVQRFEEAGLPDVNAVFRRLSKQREEWMRDRKLHTL